eukprot:g2551.t1
MSSLAESKAFKDVESHFSPGETAQLRKQFNDFDKNGDGTISAEELTIILKAIGEKVSPEKVSSMIKEVDVDGSGDVSWKEFLFLIHQFRTGAKQDGAFLGTVQKHAKLIVMKTATGGKHSFSEEEKAAFSEHINLTLGGDKDLDMLPIDPSTSDLFKATHNGLLLCKLINAAVPGTVDERALNIKKKLNIYEIRENQNLCINAAKAIGCVLANVHAGSLIDGENHPHIVLGLVWQIVKIQILASINLKHHPELVRLLEEDEELQDLLNLPPEQILLRWINFHLKEAGSDRRVKNFGKDLKDSEAYTILLNQIAPSTCDKKALSISDPKERAANVIRNAKAIGVPAFIQPNDIARGNKNLNLAFCAQIFNTNHGLTITEEEKIDMAGLMDDDVGDSREERVFRLWINSLGIPDLYVNNLFEDLRNGVVLLKVMDKVQPGIVSWKRVNLKPKMKFHKLENANYAVVLGKKMNFSLVGIGGVDIVDGNKKLILAIVWQLLRLHTMNLLASLRTDGKPATDKDVVNAANALVKGSGSELSIKSFKDKHLGNGEYLMDLVAAKDKRVVNPDFVVKGATSDEDKENNAKYVISVARKIGCCVFLTWEDIVEVKPKMILTFCASVVKNAQDAGKTKEI